MNYLTMINLFWDLATTNPLSTGQVSLYFALLHVCNRSNWTEWFQAPNQVLSVLTGLSRSGILKARNELKQKGLIDFKERGTRATVYKLMEDSKQDSKQKSTQDSTQAGYTIANSTQDSVQDSVQDSTQD
ncbi:MAG: helix-turn-helix domain-containing protein, partial [Lachnospiraceae bacterium]|nr:helix-turn-helix domain-containing protein [Lachnospiraceae bacterium]